MADPLLSLERVSKVYRRSLLDRAPAFRLDVDRTFEGSQIVGVLGPNGAGKTTLFEMIAGSNVPTGGRILVAGQDIHRVRYRQRDRLAIHYHQSYQVRSFAKRWPAFMLEAPHSAYPQVHLFDEPQFNTQDGYIGFMLDFFRRLKREGRARIRVPAPHRRVSTRDPARDLRTLPVRQRRSLRGTSRLRGACSHHQRTALPRQPLPVAASLGTAPGT